MNKTNRVSVSLSEVAAGYQTRNTLFTIGVSGWERMLTADPRRYYVSFRIASPVGFQSIVIPGPVVDGFTPGVTIELPEPCKFVDQPSACIGEWYVFGTVGEVYIITEILKVS